MPSMRPMAACVLILTLLLCLPSLAAGAALLVNVGLHRPIGEWSVASSICIAMGIYVGRPLLALAALAGIVAALSSTISTRLKFALLAIVSLGAFSTLCLSLVF